MLWHQWLGHISENCLKTLHDQGILSKINSHDLELCEHCILRQMKRDRFTASKSYDLLQLIHSNIFGLVSTLPINGARYFCYFYGAIYSCVFD